MPIPRQVAHFNRRVTNRITRHVAWWLPGFAIVIHVGRRSGRTYETPVNVFREGGRYVFALTYGAESDWVRNVLAAGGCRMKTRRQSIELRDPQRFDDPSRKLVPAPARWVLGLIGVDQFLGLSRASETRATARPHR